MLSRGKMQERTEMQEMQEVPGASQTEGSGKNNALQLDLYSCVIQEPEF